MPDVKVDLSPLKGLVSEANIKAATGIVTQILADDIAEYVPVDTGALQDSGRAPNTDKGEITWDKEYADIVYNSGHIVSAGNPNGTAHWIEAAKRDLEPAWAKVAVETLFRGYLQ